MNFIVISLQKPHLIFEVIVDRSAHSDSKHPHVEITVKFDSLPGDLGMTISWEESLPVVYNVRKFSTAWNEGVCVGDALYSVNDLGPTAAYGSILNALQQRPLTLTLWRRPIGTDITGSWKQHLHPRSPESHCSVPTSCDAANRTAGCFESI